MRSVTTYAWCMATRGTLTPAIRPTAPAHTPVDTAQQLSSVGTLGATTQVTWGPLQASLPWSGLRAPEGSPVDVGPGLGISRVSRNTTVTCTVDHAGRLDGAVLCFHGCHAPHPKIISLHTDAGHRAPLDDLEQEELLTRPGAPPRALTLALASYSGPRELGTLQCTVRAALWEPKTKTRAPGYGAPIPGLANGGGGRCWSQEDVGSLKWK